MEYGHQAFHGLASWFALSKEPFIHPLPIRPGYFIVCAFFFKIWGASYSVLGFISAVSLVLFLSVCFNFVRKYFDLDTALVTVLFLASSPLMLGLGRRAMTDSCNNLFWGLTVWLFLDVLLKPGRFSYFGFITALIFSITFKESTLILIPFFVLFGAAAQKRGMAINGFQIGGIFLFPLIMLALFYGWLYGGVGPLIALVEKYIKSLFITSGLDVYGVSFCSGPWYRYLLDFLLLTPFVTILFIGYLGYLIVHRSSWDFKKLYLVCYFIYVYLITNVVAHGKIVRHIINLEMVMALFAALMLREVFKSVNVNKYQHLLFVSVMGIFIYNLISFSELWYTPSLLDPVSCHLLVLRHLIPG